MSDESLNLNWAYFDAKADRYHAAFESAPAARALEVLPLLHFLGRAARRPCRQMVLADVLCGDGHFAKAMIGCFRHIHGVDLSPALLRFFPKTLTTTPTVAALNGTTDILNTALKPDAIISVAGLHHIHHIQNNVVDSALSDARQLSILLNWAECLPQDGVMVIADIPDPNIAGDYSRLNSPFQIHDECLASRAQSLLALLAQQSHLPGLPLTSKTMTVAEYVEQVIGFSNCSPKAQPGHWFRQVVSKKSMYGHVDHFPNPSNLVAALKSHGFDVGYYDLPTPLLFPSIDSFNYFFYEVFCLGPEVNTASEISPVQRRQLQEDVQEHLGFHVLPGGSVSVGWRSAYYVVTRSDDRP